MKIIPICIEFLRKYKSETIYIHLKKEATNSKVKEVF